MTIYNIIMPKLGESVTEGTIVKWLVKQGDVIKQYDNLLEIETDKVVAEVPATVGGIVKEILFKEGETVKVGTIICTIEENKPLISNTPNISKNLDNSSINFGVNTNKNEFIASSTKSLNRYSPAVLTLAQEHGIDLTQVQGTGFEARITRKDILNYINNNTNSIETNTISSNNSVNVDLKLPNDDTSIPVSPIRKAIAKKMVESVTNIPHAWLTIEVDATNLVALRNKIKEQFLAKEGFSITYFAFFITEIVKALHKFPLLNSIWHNDKILLKKDINISIAIAVGNDLFVPVIKNADNKNFKGIAKEIFDLASKAKNKLLTANDMHGGTFTINNTGSFGSIISKGIINYPQAAILQVESIVKRPVVVGNNMIAIRDIVNLSLSIDHRIIDGFVAGNFLKQVKSNIENIGNNYDI